jgi:hypothetical protein
VKALVDTLAGFGAGASSFGGQGTRGVAYAKTLEVDNSQSGGAKTNMNFNSITAMPAYAAKCVEELRWEDYQVWLRQDENMFCSA